MGWRAILLVLAALPSFLRGELLPVRSYSTADGLAGDRVDRILADSRGFLWFCTPEGLSRFDGYRFINYGAEEGLPHPMVSSLIETRTGDYLVGTARGLRRFSRGVDGHQFAIDPRETGLSAKRIMAMSESLSGRIRIATPRELFESEGQHTTLRRSFPSAVIQDLLETPGDLWVATSSGLHLLSDGGAARVFTRKEGLPGDWVETLLFDSKGRLWAGTRGGLARFGRNSQGDWTLENVYGEGSGLVNTDIKALAEAPDGALWLGTMSGISLLKPAANDPPVFENLTRAQGLSDRAIISLAQDQAGNMWAGTEGAGVMRIARVGFTTYREPDGLRSDRVFSVLESRAGELMAVTMDPGSKRAKSVAIFDGVRFRNVAPGKFADNPSWGWNQVLLQSRLGEWWGATNEGLCRFAAVNAADLDRRQPQICYPSGIVFRIFEDSTGAIWASSQYKDGEDQLKRWDPRTNTISNFPPPRVPGRPPDDLVSAFAEDRHGNIWMGLFTGGLYRFNGREFRYFQKSDGVPGGSVLTLLADEGGLWVGSLSGGLGRVENLTDDHPRFRTYTTSHGLASDAIHCLVEDRQGRLYAGTGRGLDRLDPKTGHIRHFSSDNGLARGEFQSAVRDSAGSLWFATGQGVSRLTPEPDRPAPDPRVFVTGLRIGGVPFPISHRGETFISKLELKPSGNQLQVDFVGIDYEPGDALRYTYKLEGADSSWNPPRSQHSVNYAALSGGTYRFLVKAVTSEGVDSAKAAEIDFTVLPPLWNRWWFESLVLALAAALVFAAHRYRLAQMMSLERMRTAIATDLHDDIGSSLSQIAILSEVARVGGNAQGRPGEPLERVAVLARELVDSMGDIVWSIRSEPHGMDSLIRRMREFALDLLGFQGIAFQLKTPPGAESVQLTLQARRQLFLIFKECVHNAARHSHCTSVVSELKVVGREVVLTVADNGAGLDSGQKAPGSNGGTGVPSMRRRAESLGGRMEFTSKPGQGLAVAIHIPARRGTFAQAGR